MCCRVSRFCCCCHLRTGAIIVTVFSAILVVYCIAMAVLSFTSYEDTQKYVVYKKDHFKDMDPKTRMWIQRGVWLAIAITGCLITVCLCCALSNNRAGCVIPWLIWDIITIIGVIMNAILSLVAKKWLEGSVALIPIPFAIYIWVCMYSFYKELQEGVHITRSV